MKDQISKTALAGVLFSVFMTGIVIHTLSEAGQAITVTRTGAAFIAGALMIPISTWLTEKTGAKGLTILWITPAVSIFFYFQVNTGLPSRDLIWAIMYATLLGAATTDYFIEPEVAQ